MITWQKKLCSEMMEDALQQSGDMSSLYCFNMII